MQNFKGLFWALILCAGMTSSAEASTYSVGTLTSSPFVTSSMVSRGRFTDRYDFSIEVASEEAASVTNIPLELCDIKILNTRGLTLSVFDSADNHKHR